jgi:membrane protein DedA with SNARE-associated domain
VNLLPFRHFLWGHGYSFLFGYVLTSALGLPLPADPLFVLMGAMTGNHQYSLPLAVLISALAALLGDSLWYQLGRAKGTAVLGLLCKLSLEPDTCVRKTQATFAKRGALALLIAHFVPGVGLISVSLAGVNRLPFLRFLLADGAGCILWAGTYLSLGRIFYKQVDLLLASLGLFGRRAGVTFLVIVALYVLLKYLQRQLFLRELRINRVTPEEARALLANGEPISIVDLRHPAEIEREKLKIAGAMILRADDLRSRSHQIPEDQQIILYCS